uniref:Putative cnidarian restricted protein n=1 Tax=Clytia hemisphaerica TaxID=252671 RepID=A0A069DLV4_9CNID
MSTLASVSIVAPTLSVPRQNNQRRPDLYAVYTENGFQRNSTFNRSTRRPMKTDRRKCFMLVLGVLQILLGSLFLSLGLWSVMIVRSALYATGLSPFFLAVLSYVGGGLTVYGPRSTNNNLVMLVIGVSTFTCFLSLSLGCWMFISLMHSSAPNITSYKSFLMGLNVFLMLDTGIIAIKHVDVKRNCSAKEESK